MHANAKEFKNGYCYWNFGFMVYMSYSAETAEVSDSDLLCSIPLILNYKKKCQAKRANTGKCAFKGIRIKH